MIKNERAQRITHAQAEKFRAAIAAAERDGPPKGVHPRLHRASIAGMASQLKTLDEELRAYDQLRSAKGRNVFSGRLEDLGTFLISSRIARHLTQRDLGERLGVTMQQVQQHEADGYEHAGMVRVHEVLQALGAHVEITVRLVPLADTSALMAPPAKAKAWARR